ncbi:adenosylcobinamide amidohydrolase [Neobacillus cucumis]|uniref:adenosylcobinamide amidohydrolase n=1 Tax=Neobacillus cucumis TaxID=1740721 RepID=UPI00203FFB27|nr:adenosylcobinamide amidohydrolase [Neobacillus cucumis]MCM3728471.1 adenosylcobinamide amidohydrolase [Neobacillus cucumis]
MQPFRKQNQITSRIWPELRMVKKEDHLLFQFPRRLAAFSSAVHGGGFQQVSHFVNWQVPLDYASNDPILLMKQKITEWEYPLEQTAGLQTAAKIHCASIQEEHGDEFRIVCCVTAGVGNRERAGRKRKTYSAYQCGTINTFLFIDGRLTEAAMINGIITATEAKAAAMQDLQIKVESGEFATGTTTDSVVLAASQADHLPTHLFAGTATTIGNTIGCLVYEATCEAVRNQEG